MRDKFQVVFSRWSAAHWDAGTCLIIGGGMPLLTARLFITRMGRWGRWTRDCIPGRHLHVWPPQAGWGVTLLQQTGNRASVQICCIVISIGNVHYQVNIWLDAGFSRICMGGISIVFKVRPLGSGDIYHLTRNTQHYFISLGCSTQ